MIKSFPPIIDNNCRMLILGTMPSVKSLEAGEYYAHERNAFWPILFKTFGETYIDDFNEKKRLALKYHIAVWDVLAACEREGSLDSKIKMPVPNDIKGLLLKYPQIAWIFFNGAAAQRLFEKYVKEVSNDLRFRKLPSTSPANASMTAAQKLEIWRRALITP